MGEIRIEVKGSFRPRVAKTFSAMEHGHADAVAQAIEFLSGEVLPAAIKLDHELSKDVQPSGGFGR